MTAYAVSKGIFGYFLFNAQHYCQCYTVRYYNHGFRCKKKGETERKGTWERKKEFVIPNGNGSPFVAVVFFVVQPHCSIRNSLTGFVKLFSILLYFFLVFFLFFNFVFFSHPVVWNPNFKLKVTQDDEIPIDNFAIMLFSFTYSLCVQIKQSNNNNKKKNQVNVDRKTMCINTHK